MRILVAKLVSVFNDPYVAAQDAHAIVVLTEWDEFKVRSVCLLCAQSRMFQELDYEKLYASMKKPAAIFDGRMILDQSKLRKIGFRVFCIGSAATQSFNLFP